MSELNCTSYCANGFGHVLKGSKRGVWDVREGLKDALMKIQNFMFGEPVMVILSQ